MKNVIKFSVVLMLTLSSIIFYMYYKHVQYIDKLTHLSNLLQNEYTEYCASYSNCEIYDADDFEKMLLWSTRGNRQERSGSPYSILANNYGIAFDSIRNASIVYSYGFDDEDDNLGITPFNGGSDRFSDQYPIYQGNFSTFLLDLFHGYDIKLATFSFVDVDCSRYHGEDNKRILYRQFEIFDGVNSLLNTKFEKRLRRSLYNFALTYIRKYPEESINDFDTLILTYDDGKIEFVCDSQMPENSKIKLSNELETYLKQNEVGYFDYALFHLIVPEVLR